MQSNERSGWMNEKTTGKSTYPIYVDGEQIVLKKYERACIFCGEAKDVKNYKGKNICKECLDELRGK
jgi:transcriptional pleiotropic regulator of transition state genes